MLLRLGWGGGRETRREREQNILFSLAEERSGGGSLQRPIHLSSWHPSQRGVGVAWE